MTRFIVGSLAAAVLAAGCSGEARSASEPAPEAAAVTAPGADSPSTSAAHEIVDAAPAEPAARPAARSSARPNRPVARPPAPERAKSAPAPRPVPAPAETSRVPEYREVTIPAGTVLPLELRSSVSSATSQVEDRVRGVLRQALNVDGVRVLPAGTEINGTVVEAAPAGRVKGRARVVMQFTSLRYDGEQYSVQAEPVEHQAEATKGEDATKIGVGAGAGAVIGGLLGGGSGAVKGAALGGAAGTGVVLATRGKEVALEPGADASTRLTAPLTIRIMVR